MSKKEIMIREFLDLRDSFDNAGGPGQGGPGPENEEFKDFQREDLSHLADRYQLRLNGKTISPTKEAILLDVTMPRYDHMRRDKAVILYYRMMSNMIPAPDNNVVTYLHKRLYGIVFKDEAIISNI